MKWAVHLQIRREARASWKNITTHRNKLLWDLLTVSVLQFPEWWLHRPAAPYAPLDGGRDRRNYWGIANTSRTDRCTSRMSTTNRALEPFKEGKYRVTEKGWGTSFFKSKATPWKPAEMGFHSGNWVLHHQKCSCTEISSNRHQVLYTTSIPHSARLTETQAMLKLCHKSHEETIPSKSLYTNHSDTAHIW